MLLTSLISSSSLSAISITWLGHMTLEPTITVQRLLNYRAINC